MSNTSDRFTQETAQPDLELFVGASDFVDTSANATNGSSAEGFLTKNLASTLAGTFFSNITAYLRRTGVLATTALAQMQFGTAAGVPGPTAVAGTSDPSALPLGMPPFTGASMATVAGARAGAPIKGLQINSMDVIYSVNAVNATLAQCSLTKTVFVDNVAPAVTSLITLGANGLAVAFRANPYRTNIVVAAPAFIVNSGAEVLAHVNLTAGTAGTINFFGVNLKCSYNLN